MIDVKSTLKNLNGEFPDMTIDDLFRVLECFKEDYTSVMDKPHYNYKSLDRLDNTLYNTAVTCK